MILQENRAYKEQLVERFQTLEIEKALWPVPPTWSREGEGAEADDRGRTTQRWCSQPRNSAIQRLGKSVRKNSVEIIEKPAGAGLKRRQIEVGGAPARPGNPHSGPTQPKRGHRAVPGAAWGGQERPRDGQEQPKARQDTARRGQNPLQKGRRRR